MSIPALAHHTASISPISPILTPLLSLPGHSLSIFRRIDARPRRFSRQLARQRALYIAEHGRRNVDSGVDIGIGRQ